MNKPRIYQPARSFAQKAKAPGGITIEEAMTRADNNMAASRDRYFEAIDEKLRVAMQLATAKNDADLMQLRGIAAEVADLASAYDLIELFSAAASLRHMMSMAISSGVSPSWAAIRVHVEAMISLRRPEINGEASARRQVLEGLKKVAEAAAAAAPGAGR